MGMGIYDTRPDNIQYLFEHYAADAGRHCSNLLFRLGKDQAAGGIEERPATGDSKESERLLLALIKRESAACGISSMEELRSEMVDYSLWRNGSYRVVRLLSDAYIHLVEACRGRSLLIDELQQLIEASGVELAGLEALWPAYLQLAHLNGDVSLTNGLQVQEKRDWRRWFRRVPDFVCKRCGSGAERMFWSPCLQCGQACPYCEECLTMGRVRSCSLLVLGGSSEAASKVEAVEDLQAYLAPWGLSDAQTKASLDGLRYIQGSNPMAQVNSSSGPSPAPGRRR